MIGLLFLVGATLYEVYALIFHKQTISAFIWQLMENRWFRAGFTFTWFWLTIHLLFPEYFSR